MTNPIYLALDLPKLEAARAMAEKVKAHVGGFKLGLEFFCAHGHHGVHEIAHVGLPIFLDLKLHDIPNTMRGAIRAARGLGCRFITVHAGAGASHLRACVEEAGPDLGVLAVTVLTSQDAAACTEAGHTRTPAELVALRAALAHQAGCAGVVCSGQELAKVRAAAPGIACVVPGIRPAGADVGDQKRVMTPGQAIADGAAYLVIGRPILAATNPAAAADAIVAEMVAGAEAN